MWTSRWWKAPFRAKRTCTGSSWSARAPRLLISLGDCAITGNVPAMRNRFGAEAVLRRAYLENGTLDAADPPRDCSRRCCPRRARCMRWCRWMCSSPAARLPPTSFFRC